MSTIVGRDSSHLTCDTVGCKSRGPDIYGENSGQGLVDQKMREMGWRVSFTDKKVTCPKCWRAESAIANGNPVPYRGLAWEILNDIDSFANKTDLAADPKMIERVRMILQNKLTEVTW